MSEQQTSTETWDGLLTNYLKADNLEEQKDSFDCISVNVEDSDMDLELERGDEKFVYSLNTTNKVFLKNNGITKPKDVIGKTIHIEKVRVFNPTAKKEVDGLRIYKIE